MSTNKNPLISVIVANYNGAPYLEECLNSVVQQTYQAIEIIVADDGSCDDSPQIIRNFQKTYPKIVRTLFSPRNQGVALTRHQAIQQAKGEYLTTLDSDDFFFNSHKLKQEMSLIQSRHQKEKKDIVAFSNIMVIQQDGRQTDELGTTENIKQGDIFTELLCRSCMIPRDFVIKKDIYFEVGGYDLSLKTHEDWDLKLRLASKYNYYYTGSLGTAYRRHEQGLSSIAHWQRTDNLWRVFYHHYFNINNDARASKNLVKEKFKKFMKQRDTYFFNHTSSHSMPRIKNRLIHNKWRLKYFYLSQKNG